MMGPRLRFFSQKEYLISGETDADTGENKLVKAIKKTRADIIWVPNTGTNEKLNSPI